MVWFDVEHRLETVSPGAPPPLVVAPPVTRVLRPTTNEEVGGVQLPVASASAELGVDKVVFHISGEGRSIVVNAATFAFGWGGEWNTTTVPNGSYTVRSVAYGATGQVSTSAGIAVRVNNE